MAQGIIKSWGLDNFGQVTDSPTDTGFVQVAGGAFHSLALRTDGSIASWGWDNKNQVTDSPTGTGFVQVAGGTFHSLALRADGSIASWGDDTWGQVSNTPLGAVFVQVAGGGYHSLALRADGSIACWGRNNYKQVSDTPPGTGFVQVTGGDWHSLALRTDGSIAPWGDDTWGQVSNTPPATGFVQVAGGGLHSLALMDAGNCNVVFCDTDANNLGDVTLNTCDCSGGSIMLSLSTPFTNQFTYPLVGLGTTAVSPTGVSELCLAGSTIGRYSKDAGAISATGTFSIDLLNASSAPGGGVPTIGGALCNGNTWRFQYWHRDGMNPSRFSKGISGLIN